MTGLLSRLLAAILSVTSTAPLRVLADDAVGNALGYAYDFENHLIRQGGISIVYDGDGNRVSKTVAGLTTTYMVDPFSITGYAQVVYESFSGKTSAEHSGYGRRRYASEPLTPGKRTIAGIGSIAFQFAHSKRVDVTHPCGACFCGRSLCPALVRIRTRARWWLRESQAPSPAGQVRGHGNRLA